MSNSYFSQYGQDRFLNEHVFRGLTGGNFIDVGAFNGVNLSNTLFFEKYCNWSGICFEPNPNAFAELRNNRRCRSENCCISNETGIVQFTKIDGYSAMLSGISAKHSLEMKHRIADEIGFCGGSQEVIWVKAMPLREFITPGERIDYLSVDVEGGELDVLRSIDFDACTIRCVSVEDNDPAVRPFMEERRYKLVAKIGIDWIFVLP